MEDAGNAADTLEDAVASNQQAGKPGLENSAGQNLGKLPKYTKTDVNRIAEDSGFDVTSVVTPMKAEPATETSTAMPLAKAMARTAGRPAAAAAKAVAVGKQIAAYIITGQECDVGCRYLATMLQKRGCYKRATKYCTLHARCTNI